VIVYQVLNTVTRKIYIGKTERSFEIRKKEHLYLAKKNSSTYFHRALYKYKEHNFIWTVLCSCNTKEELDRLEVFYIMLMRLQGNLLYNQTSGGEGATGYHHTQETKKKISIASVEHAKDPTIRQRKHVGQVNSWKDPIRKEKFRRAMKGRCFSQETRHKISIALKGKILSIETKQKLSTILKGRTAWNKGKKLHYVVWNKGVPCAEHTKEKLRNTNLGKTLSSETRAKISNSCKGKERSEEYRKKLSESGKLGWIKRRKTSIFPSSTCHV